MSTGKGLCRFHKWEGEANFSRQKTPEEKPTKGGFTNLVEKRYYLPTKSLSKKETTIEGVTIIPSIVKKPQRSFYCLRKKSSCSGDWKREKYSTRKWALLGKGEKNRASIVRESPII